MWAGRDILKKSKARPKGQSPSLPRKLIFFLLRILLMCVKASIQKKGRKNLGLEKKKGRFFEGQGKIKKKKKEK